MNTMIRDTDILKHALMGYEKRLREIDEEVARLKERIARRRSADASVAGSVARVSPIKGRPRKTRVLSTEARARMAKAQKKRWAAWRRERKAA